MSALTDFANIIARCRAIVCDENRTGAFGDALPLAVVVLADEVEELWMKNDLCVKNLTEAVRLLEAMQADAALGRRVREGRP